MSTAVYEPSRALIEGLFNDGWTTRTPVKWSTTPFQVPSKTDWVALTLLFGDSNQISMGPQGQRLERHTGLINLQIFTPQGQGTKAAYEHADFAGGIFRMKTVKDSQVTIVFRTPEVFNPLESDEWFNVVLRVEFQIDATF